MTDSPYPVTPDSLSQVLQALANDKLRNQLIAELHNLEIPISPPSRGKTNRRNVPTAEISQFIDSLEKRDKRIREIKALLKELP